MHTTLELMISLKINNTKGKNLGGGVGRRGLPPFPLHASDYSANHSSERSSARLECCKFSSVCNFWNLRTESFNPFLYGRFYRRILYKIVDIDIESVIKRLLYIHIAYPQILG